MLWVAWVVRRRFICACSNCYVCRKTFTSNTTTHPIKKKNQTNSFSFCLLLEEYIQSYTTTSCCVPQNAILFHLLLPVFFFVFSFILITNEMAFKKKASFVIAHLFDMCATRTLSVKVIFGCGVVVDIKFEQQRRAY